MEFYNAPGCAEKRDGTEFVRNDGKTAVFPCIRGGNPWEPTVESEESELIF